MYYQTLTSWQASSNTRSLHGNAKVIRTARSFDSILADRLIRLKSSPEVDVHKFIPKFYRFLGIAISLLHRIISPLVDPFHQALSIFDILAYESVEWVPIARFGPNKR